MPRFPHFLLLAAGIALTAASAHAAWDGTRTEIADAVFREGGVGNPDGHMGLLWFHDAGRDYVIHSDGGFGPDFNGHPTSVREVLFENPPGGGEDLPEPDFLAGTEGLGARNVGPMTFDERLRILYHAKFNVNCGFPPILDGYVMLPATAWRAGDGLFRCDAFVDYCYLMVLGRNFRNLTPNGFTSPNLFYRHGLLPETEPPEVLAVSPSEAGPPDAAIRVTFSELMGRDGLREAVAQGLIRVEGSQTGRRDFGPLPDAAFLTREFDVGDPEHAPELFVVPWETGPDGQPGRRHDCAGLLLQPETPFAVDETVTVTISSGLRDLGGNATETSTTTAWTVLAPLAPPAPLSPADGAAGVDPAVALRWNVSGETARFDVRLWKAANPEPGFDRATGLATLEWDPPGLLDPDTEYLWRVMHRDPWRSAAGPAARFRTAPAPEPDPAPMAALIAQLYSRILGRAPEAGAAEAWTGGFFANAAAWNLDLRLLPAELARLLFQSPEYAAFGRSDEAFIADCYWTYLERGPSADELAAWTGGVWTRGQALALFADSEEFRARAAALYPGQEGSPARNLAAELYLGLLERLPDEAGLEWLTAALETAPAPGASLRDAAAAIATSDEFTASAADPEETVRRLYRGLLGRFPSDSELAWWAERLGSGGETLESTARAIGTSEEFASSVEDALERPAF